jgi:hypothetical protein
MTDNHDQPAVPGAPQPLPGQQFPAAILPQSDYGTAPHPTGPYPGGPQPTVNLPQSEPFPASGPPSGPFPAAGPPSEPFPAAPQPNYPPQPRKPRNKPVIILTTLAIVFFFGTGTFAALWLVEQGDHKGTSSELQTVQGNLTKTADELKTAQAQKTQADLEKQRVLRDAEATKPCLDAAKALIRAFSEEEADKQYEVMIQKC